MEMWVQDWSDTKPGMQFWSTSAYKGGEITVTRLIIRSMRGPRGKHSTEAAKSERLPQSSASSKWSLETHLEQIGLNIRILCFENEVEILTKSCSRNKLIAIHGWSNGTNSFCQFFSSGTTMFLSFCKSKPCQIKGETWEWRSVIPPKRQALLPIICF